MTMTKDHDHGQISREEQRERRRLRFRRHGRRALIRSVYSLPSLATLGNAICGFGAMYLASFDGSDVPKDPLTSYLTHRSFIFAAYLIFLAMVFDALDGRLARFTRHTTDFGGQLDSLADVISFGAAPAFMAIQLFRGTVDGLHLDMPVMLTRLVWAIGALYMSCAAIRLARFNVSNEHGEQHHFSFFGLPSPGAGGTVAAFILMQQTILYSGHPNIATICVWILPVIVLLTGLLMVATIRYPHLVNRYLRGRHSPAQLIIMLIIGLAFIVAYRYALAFGTIIYVLWGPVAWAYARIRPKPPTAPPTPA